TGNLDSRTGDAVFQLLLDQVQESFAPLVMVTHSESLAARLDRTLRMVDGRLLAEDGAGYAEGAGCGNGTQAHT
ncbi:MAG: hypothetical protein R6V07_09105, partial [Armatimonadota bacterium]